MDSVEKAGKFKALPHQERSADKLEDSTTGAQLAYHSVGSGKGLTSINAATRQKLPILAIVPAALRNNYKKELEAAGNPVPSRVMSYQEAVNQLGDPAFHDEASKSFVVFDESHRLGQQESQRSQLARLPAKRKMLLTATPIRNHPSELAPLVHAINPDSLPFDKHEFNKQFIESREVPVGFFGRLLGAKPGVEHVPKNLNQLADAVRGNVDHYEAVDRSAYPSFSETIHEVPMTHKQQASYDYMLGNYPALAYKVKHGIPPGIDEDREFGAFFSGPRQVSNHPGAFNSSATDEDAPKFHRAADEIEKRRKTDPNFRGVVYSSFLDAGLHPMSRILTQRGVPHAVFSGGLNDKERKKLIDDYNQGRNPVLLLSGAGAEGLDLKGTKLMQLMEPHWNEELMDQVRGRAIRYKSHAHLPDDERHVEVQRFHAVPRRGFIGRLMAKKPHGRGVDQYLYEVAKRKRELNKPFLDVLKEEGQKEASILFVEFTEEDDTVKIASNTYPKLTNVVGKLYPGNPSARYDYSHEVMAASRMLGNKTGVPRTPDGELDFDHPRVAPVMDLVRAGHIEVPKSIIDNRDDLAFWRWADSKRALLQATAVPVKAAMPIAQNAAGHLVHLQRSGHGVIPAAPKPLTTRGELATARSLEREDKTLGLTSWPHADPPAGYSIVPVHELAGLTVPPK